MEKVKRQHYVPRMYLRRFGYGEKGKEHISVLKLDTGSILEKQRVENFAVSNCFYDVEPSQLESILKIDMKFFPELYNYEKLQDEQYVEHMLAKEEAAVSNLLNELQKDSSKIQNIENESLIIMFVHSLAYRTKQFRDGIDEVSDGKSGKNTQIHQILGMAPILKTMNMLLKNYDWYIAINNTELDFVISDNPAKGVRLGFNDICIPISCNKAIIFKIKDKNAPLITKSKAEKGIIDLSLKDVISYNVWQLATGQLYLFGTSKAIKFMKTMWEFKNTLLKND